MQRVRGRKTGQLCGAVGLAVLGAASLPAQAQNLLINSGFEAPQQLPPAPNQNIAGWTLVNDVSRAQWGQDNATHPTPDTSDYGVWAKTFQDVGGGVFQDVSGITPGEEYDLSSYLFFEAGFATIVDPVAARMSLTFLDSGGSPLGSPTLLDITPQDSPPLTAWTEFTLSATAPVGAAAVRTFLGWDGGGLGTGGQSVMFDNAELLGPGAPPANAWLLNDSGDWNLGGNWALGSVPNAVGAEAQFLGAITSAETVYTNTPVTVGIMRFNNANTYVISGAGNLTVETSSGNAMIDVQQGSHKINLPVRFNSNTDVTVAGGAALNFADPVTIAANRAVNTTGNVQFNAPLTLESAADLSIGSNSRLFGAPSIGSGAQIDINTNAVTIDYNGPASPLSTIRGQIVSGYNGGPWNGQGIISSDANNTTHGVGYAEASELGTVPAAFGSVDDTAVLVRYTRYGDATLDGLVNLLDFNRLAANFGLSNQDWFDGDFTYDGIVNLNDFNRLAANFGLAAAGTEVTPQDWSNLAAAVPEPAGATTLLLAGSLVAVRRRRSA